MPVDSAKKRERVVVKAGAAIALIALVVRFALLPFAARWNAREDVIASSAETIARMRALISDSANLRSSIGAGLPTSGRQLVFGRTAALAGSALQTAIQSDADRSRLTINRLDLAGTPDSSAKSPVPVIPVSISAVGDVYGLSDFLSMLQYGSPVVEIRQLTIVSNSSLRGGLLQISLQLNAPATIE